MIPESSKVRIARPTDNLIEITTMHDDGLGFKRLGSFEGHNGFNGSIIGHPKHIYHLEFTHHVGATVGKAPTKVNLIVFYFTEFGTWNSCCLRMKEVGFKEVSSYNSYWDEVGKTFEAIDGYRVVLQNREWSA